MLTGLTKFFKSLDPFKAFLALFFILLGVQIAYPDVFSNIEPIKGVIKYLLACLSCLGGIYLLYKEFIGKKFITVESLISGGVGLLLIGIGTYLGLGVALNSIISELVNIAKSYTPFIIAMICLFLGAKDIDRQNIKSGFILILIALVMSIVGLQASGMLNLFDFFKNLRW